MGVRALPCANRTANSRTFLSPKELCFVICFFFFWPNVGARGDFETSVTQPRPRTRCGSCFCVFSVSLSGLHPNICVLQLYQGVSLLSRIEGLQKLIAHSEDEVNIVCIAAQQQRLLMHIQTSRCSLIAVFLYDRSMSHSLWSSPAMYPSWNVRLVCWVCSCTPIESYPPYCFIVSSFAVLRQHIRPAMVRSPLCDGIPRQTGCFHLNLRALVLL